MPIYMVEVVEHFSCWREFYVEADSEQEAMEEAEHLAGNDPPRWEELELDDIEFTVSVQEAR